jgi:ketosteroid isomerase-like protein
MMKNFFRLFLICCLFSCKTKKPAINEEELKNAVFETDREFSKMSELKGLKNAYMEYIDSNGVLLRPNNYPIQGGEAVNFIIESNDADFIMTWEPKKATVAGSGDLAYTYGIYSYKAKNDDSVYFGSYVTIWKMQPNGKWKFVLQTGNDGLE